MRVTTTRHEGERDATSRARPSSSRSGHHGVIATDRDTADAAKGRGDRETSVRRGRGRRGDVRFAILALLNERPDARLRDDAGVGRTHPGHLEPESRIAVSGAPAPRGPGLRPLPERRRAPRVHPDRRGTRRADDRPKASAPWEKMVHEADQGDMALRAALHHVAIAVHQVAEAGTDAQKAKADEILKETRRQTVPAVGRVAQDRRGLT